jgi:nucleoside-diphosphate-sugar epimerase
MNVFLTGATGYIGGAVADALLRAGHSVTGLARSDAAAGLLQQKGIVPYRGDLASPAGLTAAAAAADGIIHTATTNDGGRDRLAVCAMLDAIARSGRPFVFSSGIWVLGDTGGKMADETTPLHPVAIAAWRAPMEELVLSLAREKLRTSVIRPAVVYGRARGIPAGFVKSAREHRAARFVGTGDNHWPAVHVEDLADLYVRALEKAPPGSLFFAAESVAHPVQEIAEAASFGAGAGGRTESWPLEEARKTLGAYADALVLDQQVSSARARAILGWQPRADGILEDLCHGSYVS